MARDWTIITAVIANYATLAATIKTSMAGRKFKVLAMAANATNIYVLIELN